MALILITYDLKETPSGIHMKVKSTMINNYKYSDKSPAKGYQLPNTCLTKSGITSEQAVDDLKASVKQHGGTLERFFACRAEDYKISDLT